MAVIINRKEPFAFSIALTGKLNSTNSVPGNGRSCKLGMSGAVLVPPYTILALSGLLHCGAYLESAQDQNPYYPY